MSTLKGFMHDCHGYFDDLPKSTQEIVREGILKAASERRGPEGYKLEEDCLEEVECRARDGFSPFSHNKGGLIYRNFTDLMEYWGGGYTPAHVRANKEIQRLIDCTFKSISEDLYADHKELCLDLNISKNQCNYNDLQQIEENNKNLTLSQAKELHKMLYEIQDMESSRLSGEDSTVMHELRFMYHGKENGLHTASVSAAINTEAPYHRSSISWARDVFCEGAKEVQITWRNNAELKRKLDKAFKTVSKAIF